PAPLADSDHKEVDLEIARSLPLAEDFEDALLSILVFHRRTLRAFEPADHVFHRRPFRKTLGPAPTTYFGIQIDPHGGQRRAEETNDPCVEGIEAALSSDGIIVQHDACNPAAPGTVHLHPYFGVRHDVADPVGVATVFGDDPERVAV